ncbi:MAG: hypothetical protein ACOC3T_00400 [Bacteroidota bacterium]
MMKNIDTSNFIMRKPGFFYFIFCFLLITISLSLRGQVLDCATLVTQNQVNLEDTFTTTLNNITELDRTFHCSFHVVKDAEGAIGIDPNDIQLTLNEASQVFERISVTFKTSKVYTINNFTYNTLYYDNTDNELVDLSYVNNTINVYLVDKLYDVEGRVTNSYTFMPGDGKDLIFIQKNSFDAVHFIQLLGHFFNLYHTHETVFGDELVDGSNCDAAGDQCCDTEAMPDLSTMVGLDCEYTGTTKDSNGDFYYPGTHNYMSSAPAACKCYFSDQQYIRMSNAMLKLKSHLW